MKEKTFRSVTTPGHTFYMIDAIAEFVCLQKYGLDLCPKFWYKSSGKPNARKTFLQTKNKLYAILNREPNIKAVDFFGIALDRFGKKEIAKTKRKKKRITLKEKKEIDAKNKKDIEHNIIGKEDGDKRLIELNVKQKKNVFGEYDG